MDFLSVRSQAKDAHCSDAKFVESMKRKVTAVGGKSRLCGHVDWQASQLAHR